MRLRNYSSRTISNYLSCLKKVCDYYNLPPGKINSAQFKTFLYYLIKDCGMSVSQINQSISVWKILQCDILKRDWDHFKIKRPRRVKKTPVVLSQQEVALLINSPSNLKHKTLLQLTYATGLRRSEVLGIKLAYIDRARKVIKVNGKGNKQREVFMSDELLQLLEKYYKRYRPKTFLFESRLVGTPYSASSFRNILINAIAKTKINKQVSPHTLRHTFATHMLERGVNLRRLQQLMGHASMKTTSIYLHLADIDKVSLPDLLSDKTGDYGNS